MTNEGNSIIGAALSRNSILVAIGVVVTVIVGGVIFSPANAIQIIGFGSFVCIALNSELGRINDAQNTSEKLDKVAKKAEDVKTALGVSDEKVEEVKTTLVKQDTKTAQKLDDIAKVAADTHTLVNSNFEVQLKLNLELSDWKASQTKLPADIEAAEKARDLLAQHRAKQATVDAKNDKATDAAPPASPMDVNIVSSEATVPVHLKPPPKPK